MSTKERIDFPLGQTVATPGALEALNKNNTNGFGYLRRHAQGDWGIVCDEDKKANDDALHTGGRLLSAYLLADETKLWIITDAADDRGNRQSTTMLLPEEY